MAETTATVIQTATGCRVEMSVFGGLATHRSTVNVACSCVLEHVLNFTPDAAMNASFLAQLSKEGSGTGRYAVIRTRHAGMYDIRYYTV